MTATILQPNIPAPTASNLLQVVEAIRNALIAAANVDAGRANSSGTTPQAPSQFLVTSQVVVPVTYTVAGATGATVTVPQLNSITWTNNVTGQTIVWNAPGKLFNGGSIGAAL